MLIISQFRVACNIDLCYNDKEIYLNSKNLFVTETVSSMKIQLSDHFTAKRLFRFVIPSVIMMIFTSIYGVVDGFFVSNYAGKTQFAAVNLIFPFIMLISAIGFMAGTGGSALVSKTLGEGDRKRANGLFSMIVYAVLILGIVFSLIAQLILKKIAVLLGADALMLKYCVIYGRISFISMPFFMLQNVFQSFFVTAQKPHFGLFVTVLAGVANMFLDFLFVGVFKWGVDGAAAATAVSEFIGGGVPLIYFFTKNTSLLRLGKAVIDFKALGKTCTNGASELMTNVSMSLVNMIYNKRLMSFFGQNGIAAYGVIMYVNLIFLSAFIGYSIGVAPIIGYNYGAKNDDELKNMFKKSIVTISFSAVLMFAAGQLLSPVISKIFTGYDAELYALTKHAFRLFATSYLICGFNIFGSAFFTALNNGGVSAIISFSRTLLFQIATVFLIPLIFGKNSIWLSITAAEAATLIVTITFLITNKKKYNYI